MTSARLSCVQVFSLIPWLVYRIIAFHLIKIRNTVSKRKVAMGNLMIFFTQESCWLWICASFSGVLIWFYVAWNDTHFVSLKQLVCFMYCVRFHIVLLFHWKVIIYSFLLVQELKSKDIWIYNHSPICHTESWNFSCNFRVIVHCYSIKWSACNMQLFYHSVNLAESQEDFK